MAIEKSHSAAEQKQLAQARNRKSQAKPKSQLEQSQAQSYKQTAQDNADRVAAAIRTKASRDAQLTGTRLRQLYDIEFMKSLTVELGGDLDNLGACFPSPHESIALPELPAQSQPSYLLTAAEQSPN